MQNIYCLSGLGADHRIFSKLDVPNYKLIPVPWHSFDKHDELPCYAQKMSFLIKEENPIILGVSFGGMLASEIGLIRPTKKIIIVSSCKNAAEFPPFGRFFRFLINSRILPPGLMNIPNSSLYKLFGTENRAEHDMLDNIIRATDGRFAKWAFYAMQHWRNASPPENLVHIHGRLDRIIPPLKLVPHHWIDDGGHLMIYNRAEEISKIISRELAEIE